MPTLDRSVKVTFLCRLLSDFPKIKPQGYAIDETDLQTIKNQARTQIWLPCSYGDQSWQSHHPRSPQKGTQAACCLGRMRLQSRQRLRKQSDFLKVREQGNTFRCPHFFLQILIDPKRQKCLRRIGIITSRRVGIAVKRNKGRRILREIFRRNQKTLPESCDLVVVMRNTFNQASFTEMEKLFLKAIEHTVRKKVHSN